jgi:hypothetical protein
MSQSFLIRRERLELNNEQKRQMRDMLTSFGVMFPIGELRFSVVSGGIGDVVKEERIK